jgi:hypothetical protein
VSDASSTSGSGSAGWREVLILGRDTCEDTTRSRGYLTERGIPFIYRNVEVDPDADAWNRSYNGGDELGAAVTLR